MIAVIGLIDCWCLLYKLHFWAY